MEAATSGWTPASIPDLDGKTVVVTGANSGLGFEAARLFATHRATVVLTCRTEAKADRALARLRNFVSTARLEVVLLDLASLASIDAAADEIRERFPALDALVNNAGVMALPRRTTVDGFEMQFGTNHLGHFALTGRVLDLLEARGGRVVTVASNFHKQGKMDFADPMGARRYDKWRAYAQSKLANVLFMRELDHRLRAAGSAVGSLGCHPGYAATNLTTVGPAMSGSGLMKTLTSISDRLFAQTAQQGSWPTVRAVVDQTAKSGDYFGPNGFMEMRGGVDHGALAPQARDDEAAARLWQLSEDLTGVSYAFTSAAA